MKPNLSLAMPILKQVKGSSKLESQSRRPDFSLDISKITDRNIEVLHDHSKQEAGFGSEYGADFKVEQLSSRRLMNH